MTFNVMPKMFIILAFGLVGLIGLIILLAKGGSVTRWIVSIVLLVLVLGFIGVLPHKRVIVNTVQTHQNHNALLSQYAMTKIVKDPALWQPNLEAEMVPDVYSSKSTAAFGLGMQLQETIQTATGGQLTKIIVAEQPGIDIGLLEQLRQGIQTAFADIPVLINDPANVETTGGTITVALSIVNPQKHELIIPKLELSPDNAMLEQHVQAGDETGTVQAVVQTEDGKFVKEVAYDYRAWLDENSHFQTNSYSWQPLVVTSYNTALVKNAAIGQVTEEARQYLLKQMAGDIIIPDGLTIDSLRSHGVIIDEYTQKLQALSGPIWRSAMLLDVSPQRLAPLKTQVITQQQHVASTWAKLIISLAGMMTLICLVYVILNWLTKGYYSTRLAFMAVLLAILFSGILLIFNRLGFTLPFGF